MVSIFSAARDLGRLRDISRVLVRHGFGEVVRRIGRFVRPKKSKVADELDKVAAAETADSVREQRSVSSAVRARLVLEDLGPSFVKLGQIASTRPDILPQDFITELKKLQDAVPPIAFAQVKDQIESSLGAPVADIYEWVDEEPLAAASVAQVHRARLRTESGPVQVVIKVQRPGIAETVASDLEILHTFAALMERSIPESKLYSPTGLVQQFDHAITSELNFVTEADNAQHFSENFAHFPGVRFPKVYKQASSKRVITLEFLDGKKIYDAIADGHVGKKLAKLAISIMVKQVFEDGFFHADPHPGNILVMGTPDDPTYAMIDLGMVGRLSPRMREKTIDLMVAAVRKDFEGIADALYSLGTQTKRVDMNAYRAEVAHLAAKYLDKSIQDIELAEMINDLVYGATKYGLEIPTDFLMVGKALMTVEGVGKEIDPHLDVLGEVRPHFLRLLRKRYSPDRIGNEMWRRLERLTSASYQLPQLLQEILEDIRLGRLSVATENKNIEPATDRLGRRLYSGALGGGLLVGGAVCLHGHRDIIGWTLLALGLFVVLNHYLLDIRRMWKRGA